MVGEQIEVHFQDIYAFTEELLTTAEMLEQMAKQELSGFSALLLMYWKSEHAEAFARAESGLAEEAFKTAEDIKEDAQNIMKKTKRLYQTENLNYLTAKVRSYR